MGKFDQSSWRDRQEIGDKLGWNDVHFSQFMEVLKARSNSDIDRYTATVDAMDISLHGFKDEDFYIKYDELQKKYSEFNSLPEPILKEYTSDHSKLLAILLTKLNRGELSIRESVTDTRIVKVLQTNIKNGIGQNLYVTGSPGSGKSWFCLKIAEELSKLNNVPFNVKTNVTFKPEEFLKAINDEERVPRGSCVIFEEVGVNINAKRSMTTINRIMSNVFQTVRQRGIVCILNAPDLGFLEKDVRKLLHFWFQTERLLIEIKQCWIKPWIVEVNQSDGDIRYVYPRFGDYDKITQLIATPPSKLLTDQYIEYEKDYKETLRREAEAESATLTEDKKKISMTAQKQQFEDDVYDIYKDLRDKNTPAKEIQEKLKLNHRQISRLTLRYAKDSFSQLQSEYLGTRKSGKTPNK